jgi:hypothetical protein
MPGGQYLAGDVLNRARPQPGKIRISRLYFFAKHQVKVFWISQAWINQPLSRSSDNQQPGDAS